VSLVRLTARELERVVGIADAFAARLSLREACAPYQGEAWVGGAGAGLPTLHLDDVSGIPFLDDIVGVEFYQLRSRVRAGDGDLFTATCPDLPDYEAYNRDRLGLGTPRFVFAPPQGPPIAIAEACRHGEAFATLCAVAREAGGLNVHPYMGVEAVWALARDIGASAGVPVQVLGPPPPVTWFANDKRHVSDLATALVGEVMGQPPVVPTLVGTTTRELAEHLVTLARRHRRVALKMTRCASAMGNRIFDSAEVLRLAAEDPQGLAASVETFLRDKQWVAPDPVLAVCWADATASPSVQLWLPPDAAELQPRVDGVYEQLLEGPEQVFLGSIPAALDAATERWIVKASCLIGAAYRHLGYRGRCSFDFILADGAPYLVECNGRWGGTSTPMHLMDRLFPAGRPAYRARDFLADRYAGKPFAELAQALGDSLYDARTGRGRFVVYNVGCLAYGKFDVIAIGADVAAATRALEEELPARLGV
jgi:hypothetical protein